MYVRCYSSYQPNLVMHGSFKSLVTICHRQSQAELPNVTPERCTRESLPSDVDKLKTDHKPKPKPKSKPEPRTKLKPSPLLYYTLL
uniref:Uncharacterized protein n=1 Tax=Acrobeloides nanus TaxID=290746 RepID=A0A914CZZ3_9BILA